MEHHPCGGGVGAVRHVAHDRVACLARVQSELAQEEQKRAQWKLENVRRRHNYVPFIINFLKVLAERGELMPLVEAAKKRRKGSS